jgi:hypothetical protein
MAVGKLVEDIILKSIPDNCTFTVTELIGGQNDDWYSMFTYPSKTPHQVDPQKGSEKIATSLLSTTSVTDRGPGVPATLKFEYTCQTKSGKAKKTGYLKSTATNWPLIGRPDYSILIFGFDGETPLEVSRQVPTLISPDPFYIAFGQKDDQVVIVASTEDSLGTQVVSNVLDGILTVHSAAFKWVRSTIGIPI